LPWNPSHRSHSDLVADDIVRLTPFGAALALPQRTEGSQELAGPDGGAHGDGSCRGGSEEDPTVRGRGAGAGSPRWVRPWGCGRSLRRGSPSSAALCRTPGGSGTPPAPRRTTHGCTAYWHPAVPLHLANSQHHPPSRQFRKQSPYERWAQHAARVWPASLAHPGRLVCQGGRAGWD